MVANYLSGGQTLADASARLNAINVLKAAMPSILGILGMLSHHQVLAMEQPL